MNTNNDDQYMLIQDDYIEWKISNWNSLKNDNKPIKSPNFRIGNCIW